MALAHHLHYIRKMSRNKRRNMWVGWCVSSWGPWLWSIYSIYYHIHTMYYSYILNNWNKLILRDIYAYQELVRPWLCVGLCNIILSCLVSNINFNCIVHDSLYHNIDIGNVWYCALVSCTITIKMTFFSFFFFFFSFFFFWGGGWGAFWCWLSFCSISSW